MDAGEKIRRLSDDDFEKVLDAATPLEKVVFRLARHNPGFAVMVDEYMPEDCESTVIGESKNQSVTNQEGDEHVR